MPNKFAAGAKFIAHLDVDPAEIDKVKRVDWHHLGDLARALTRLREFGQAAGFDPAGQGSYQAWHAHIADLKKTYAMNFDRNSAQIQPYAVIEEINKHTKGRAIISTGVGQHQMWAAQYFDFAEPRLWLTSGSMGTMGFGLPAAIGAQFARRDRVVIDIDGDASIRMNLGELETVTTYNLPVKVVVLNNFGDGMVRQWQKLFFKGRFSGSDKSLHKKDFVKAAQADEFPWVQRLDKPEDLPRVIAEFVAFDGPAFLEVIIDTEAGVYPMVGPGMSYAEMITGEHIPSRQRPTGQEVGPAEMFWLNAAMHSGSCLCGEVRYEFDGELGPLYFCHCQRCRKAHGSAFVAAAPVAASTFRVTAGEGALGDHYAPSGLHRMFCKECGSPLFSRRDSIPDLVRIRVGSLDTPFSAKPSRHIFVASKAEWFDIHDDAPQFMESDRAARRIVRMRRIISILLQNEAGALARVAGMFSARGYNIDSLSVGATHDAAVSRLTLVTFGDDAHRPDHQAVAQTDRCARNRRSDRPRSYRD